MAPDDGEVAVVKVVKVRQPTERQRINATANLWRAMKQAQGTPQRQFENIMAFSSELAKRSPKALLGVVRLLGLSMMSTTMTQVLRQDSDHACHPNYWDDFYFGQFEILTADGKTMEDLAPMRESRAKAEIDMENDILLPWPWSRCRMLSALEGLAPGGKWGKWETELNHQTELWLPMRLVFINGGNHSLTAGLALGNVGVMRAQYVRDLRHAIPVVHCDGSVWSRACDGKVISKVASIEAAAIWEIGRLMLESKAPKRRPQTRR